MTNNTSKNLDYQLVVCPVCSGSGKNKYGTNCSNCGGIGLGIFFHNRFFYWGPRLGKAVIELNHLRQKFQFSLDLISFILGLSGFFSLVYWFYLNQKELIEIHQLMFWNYKDNLILFFFLSMIANMFIVYRISEKQRKIHRIKRLTYDEKNRKEILPNNWEELKKIKLKRKIDVSGGFTQQTIEVIEQSYLMAEKLNHKYVDTKHLFFTCLADKEISAIFSRLNVDTEKLLEKLKKHILAIQENGNKTDLSNNFKNILISAYIEAYNFGQKKVSAKNLLLSCVKKDKIIKDILYDFEVDEEKIFNVILWFIINEKQIESYKQYKSKARLKPGNNMDRAYTSVATPALNQLGYDLTVAAKWGKLEYCVAREKEIEKVWQLIESGHSGILLVGEDGVGKNAVINGIAQLMVKEDVPKFLKDKRLVELDASRLISGANPAEAQGRMMAVINEVMHAGNIILYVNNIENLIGITSGAEESLDLSEVLAGAIEKKEIICLASAVRENYVKYIEGKSLGNIMAKIDIEEPIENQAIQIIESKIGYFEGKYKIYFSYNAIKQVIELSSKYIHDKYLPAKAIEILEQTAVFVSKNKGEQSIVSKEDIAKVISEITKIPINKIGDKEGKELLKLEEKIHKRMISQEEAVKMVSSSLRRARTQLREGKRPIANFLFLGPTGVGKTELAKSVAEVYFGDENCMIRIDMSEYQHPDSIKKMIGDARGAKGRLTEAVRKSPFSLILLDEIEKAHPDILNIFLQVMDDGRLTDGQARTIDFTNSIIIATSNAGALFIQDKIAKKIDIEIIKTELINNYLNKVMRPELINRFDGVIVFKPLSMDNVVDITKLMLKNIAKLLKVKGIDIKINEDGVSSLAKQGFDPKFGARPLRRLLQDKIEDKIANKILAGELKRRDTVVIDNNAMVLVEKGRKL